ncbi:hypothetical protein MM221_10745 [Salipaludibacillus sp. LMS25]|jgi:hypothetical protein|uniref:hypothetical protein n=1 Tax=Salipaludibacillus sp. LMS25 TaxID=2924031 RepID=UPI0020D10952|nr:hypothetical protein [Salipaludibacillus sp. LMS25]UTR13136.1 hypothetical protein MM221_10745 [Salipaludibacillus sp. LMS25]
MIFRDDFTADNMGEKTLVAEVSDLNDSQELEGVTVTVEGIQYVDVVPNEANEGVCRNFEGEDIVILAAKLAIDNESNDTISLRQLNTSLIMNNDERHAISSRNRISQNKLDPGQLGKSYIALLFQEKYVNIYEELRMEVGPFRDSEAQELFKGLELIYHWNK